MIYTGTYEQLNKYEQIIFNWKNSASCVVEHAVMGVISMAQDHQLDNLRRSFPDQVKAYELYKEDSTWWVNVQSKMKGRKPG